MKHSERNISPTMSFQTFKILYLFVGIAGAAIPFWMLRASRKDILLLALVSAIVVAFFVAMSFNVTPDIPDTLFDEHWFRALTHLKPDIILFLTNALLWCILPFGIGLILKGKKHGNSLTWIFFGGFALLKTFADDWLFNHTYPETLVHPYEWGYVLVGWLTIYSLCSLFITKVIDYLTEKNSYDKPDH